MYQFWFARLFLFLTFIAVKAAVGEEVGPKGGHSHLQIFFSCLVNVAFEDALKVINKAIKDFIPIPRGDKGYISSKVLQGTQCALGMIGYISKLPMRVRLWNIDAAELQPIQQQAPEVLQQLCPRYHRTAECGGQRERGKGA